MKLEALHPLHIRRAAGDLHVQPGGYVELPDEEATRLLRKVPGKVRVAATTGTTIEPAVRPDGSPLSALYWETGDGRIFGPAKPEFLARDGNAFCISTTFEGRIWWINADRLRSSQQFEQQKPLREVELIQEVR